jgi:DNA-binding transcriptional ArsR family regulator
MSQDICVSALAKRYPVSFAAVQKHVAVLESAGLVSKRQRGREQLVTGDAGAVAAAKELLGELEELWLVRLADFEDILDRTTEGN